MLVRAAATVLLAGGIICLGGAYKSMEDNSQYHTYLANLEAGIIAGQMAGGYFRDGGKSMEERMSSLGALADSTNANFWWYLVPGAFMCAFGVAGFTARRERVAAGVPGSALVH
ncbi:MAG: hypothetical protein SFY69_08305 [Planctomycetota bacterium]|nr:hypothetical protein [Planctomycetota bacterium]